MRDSPEGPSHEGGLVLSLSAKKGMDHGDTESTEVGTEMTKVESHATTAWTFLNSELSLSVLWNWGYFGQTAGG
jgi:hypothetical protein